MLLDEIVWLGGAYMLCAVERRKGATRASARAWELIVDSVLVDANDDDDARPLEFTKYLK